MPEALLSYSLRGDEAIPRLLGDGDHPWLRALLDEYERAGGRPRRDLAARVRLTVAPTAALRGLAAVVLDRLWGRAASDGPPPKELRAALFAERARSERPRDVVIAGLAERLDISPAALEAGLFADLPSERPVACRDSMVTPAELALRANLALVQGLLYRSERIQIEVQGQSRALVRQARLGGLLCTVSGRAGDDAARLELSGPLALFGRTLLYGRALASIVPLLPWCRRFRLEARCVLRGRPALVRLATGDPIFPGQEPRRFDSRLEERFARDLARAAPSWQIIREPEPLEADGRLVFPDFLVEHRHDPGRRWLVELVGFWTPDYLDRKLASYRVVRCGRLLLCVDQERRCAEGRLPAGAAVVWFKRRVDPAAVLRVLDGPEA